MDLYSSIQPKQPPKLKNRWAPIFYMEDKLESNIVNKNDIFIYKLNICLIIFKQDIGMYLSN